MTTAATPRLTPLKRRQIELYLELDDQRKELERQARALAKEQEPLKQHMLAHVEVSGKDSVRRCGHQLSLVDGQVRPAWKDWLILLCGAMKADEIQRETKPSKRLEVVPLD